MVRSRGRVLHLEHTSNVLKDNPLGEPTERVVPVYLPPGYEENDRPCPVIWVLAAFASWGERFFNQHAWDENIPQRMDRLLTEGAAQPAILVFPDCFTRLGGSQYLNSTAVGRYADYVIQELIPFIDEQFQTLPGPKHRGVVGHSSGGFGALSLAMNFPGTFSAVACHSGDMGFSHCYLPEVPAAVRGLARAGGIAEFIEHIGTQREPGKDWFSTLNMLAMSACYSPNPARPHGFDLPFDAHSGAINDAVWGRWLRHDPVNAAAERSAELKRLALLYFDCGTYDEYGLFLGARQFSQALQTLNVPHTYEEYDGGHRAFNWRYDVSLALLSGTLSAAE